MAAFHAMSWFTPVIAIALAFGVLCRCPHMGCRTVERRIRRRAGRISAAFLPENKPRRRPEKHSLHPGGAVTLLSLLFVVMPSVESFYQILAADGTALPDRIPSDVRSRHSSALHNEGHTAAFPHRRRGNWLMWLIGGVGFLGSMLAFVLSFFPPDQIPMGSEQRVVREYFSEEWHCS